MQRTSCLIAARQAIKPTKPCPLLTPHSRKAPPRTRGFRLLAPSRTERTEPRRSHPQPHPQPATAAPASSPARNERPHPAARRPPPELTRKALLYVLDQVAASLESQGVTARAVALGGVVDTLYFQTRNETDDINIFLPHPKAGEHNALREAARLTNQRVRNALGEGWLGGATTVHASVKGRLGGEAFGQDVVVYERVGERGGLRVYAAPWEYAFCDSMRRLVGEEGRRSDAEDAARYLREHLRARSARRVRVGTIRSWGRRYRVGVVVDEALRRVNEVYGERFGSRPIVWKGPPDGEVGAAKTGGEAGATETGESAVKREGGAGAVETGETGAVDTEGEGVER